MPAALKPRRSKISSCATRPFARAYSTGIVRLEPRLDVVGVEDRVPRRVGDALGAEHPDVAVRDQQDARAAPRRRGDGVDGLLAAGRAPADGRAGTAPGAARRRSVPSRVRRRRAESRTSCAGSGDRRRRRSTPGSSGPTCAFMLAPSMYTCPPCSWTMSQISRMLVLEHAVRRRVGDHQARQAVAMLRGLLPQVVDVDVAVRRRGDDDHAHAGHRGARRIGAVCRGRNQHDVAVRARRGRGDTRGSPSGRRTRPARRSSAAATPRRTR